MCEGIIKELRAELSRTQKDYLTILKVIAANNELDAFESRRSESYYEDTIKDLEARIQRPTFAPELASFIDEIHNTLTT